MTRNLFLSSMLMCVGLPVIAQQLNVQSDSDVREILPLQELRQVTHDSNMVTFTMSNGAVYTADAGSIESVTTATQDDLLTAEPFASMRLLKEFSTIDDLEPGDVVGVFSEEDYSNEEWPVVAYHDLRADVAPMEGVLRKATTGSLDILAAKSLMRPANIRFHIANLVYVSKDYDGRKIYLSGRTMYPYSTVSNKQLGLNVYVDHHFTLIDNANAPTNSMAAMFMGGMCAKGYFQLQPDGLGLGISKDRSQLFIDQTLLAYQYADFLKAAFQYADVSRTDTIFPAVSLADDATIINGGASQGAATALGLTRVWENDLEPELAARLPKVSETHLCAGPFDMQVTMKKYVEWDKVETISHTHPILMMAAIVNHPEIFVKENGEPYEVYEFFNPIFKDQVFDCSEWGMNFKGTLWQLIATKQCTLDGLVGAISSIAGEFVAVGNEFAYMHELFAPDMTKQVDGVWQLDEDCHKVKVLSQLLKLSDNTNADLWVPKSDIDLTHAMDDLGVPYANSEQLYDNMHEKMEADGHTFTFHRIEDSTSIGNHVTMCFVWIFSELTNLSTDAVVALLKSSQE